MVAILIQFHKVTSVTLVRPGADRRWVNHVINCGSSMNPLVKQLTTSHLELRLTRPTQPPDPTPKHGTIPHDHDPYRSLSDPIGQDGAPNRLLEQLR